MTGYRIRAAKTMICRSDGIENVVAVAGFGRYLVIVHATTSTAYPLAVRWIGPTETDEPPHWQPARFTVDHALSYGRSWLLFRKTGAY